MARIDMDIDTKLSPERVFGALIDFTERRPDLWPGLARELYEVRSVGDNTADVREGSTKPMKVWAVERYEWWPPDRVRWTVVESNFSAPGSSVEARISPGQGGGSRVHVIWQRTGSNLRGKFIVALLKATRGRIIRTSVQQALDRMAERPA